MFPMANTERISMTLNTIIHRSARHNQESMKKFSLGVYVSTFTGMNWRSDP